MNNHERHHMQAQIDISFRFVTRMQELYKDLKPKYLKTIPNGRRCPDTRGKVSGEEKYEHYSSERYKQNKSNSFIYVLFVSQLLYLKLCTLL